MRAGALHGARRIGQEVAPGEQRGQRHLAVDRLAAALEAIDQAERVDAREPGEPRALDRLERRGARGDDVLEDRRPSAPGGQLGALDPLVGAVALGLLAHDERRARATCLKA